MLWLASFFLNENFLLQCYFFLTPDQKKIACRFTDIVGSDSTHKCNKEETSIHQLVSFDAPMPEVFGFVARETSNLIEIILKFLRKCLIVGRAFHSFLQSSY